MANQYNFDDGDLQLSADKVAQFTAALATEEVADPLQQLSDEAASKVARLTAGYVLDNNSIFEFIRALAVYNAYTNSGTPCPDDVETRYKSVDLELKEISKGLRVNLPKAPDAALQPNAGIAGSKRPLHGRLGSGFGDSGGQI